jgi:hypothetical protein
MFGNNNIFFKIFVLFLCCFTIIFLNIFPNIYILYRTPSGKVFSGQASWFDPWDINLYVSVIHSGQTNGLLLQNMYTSISNQSIFIYPLYTLTGNIFKTTNPFLLFHLNATFFGILLILGIFYLLQFFLKTFWEKILALLGICLGGGLGFLVYPNIQSADLSMTALTFLSAFQRGHEALGLLGYLLSLVLFFAINQEQSGERKKYLIIGVISLLISLLFYPYYFLSFMLICGIYLFIKNKASLRISSYKPLFPFLIPAIFLNIFIYQALSKNPTFSEVLHQNLPTPNLLFVLTGYGLLFLLFLYQLFFVKKNQEIIFLSIWVIVSIILAYIPLGFSRFFFRGLFFPLVILGIIAVKNIAEKIYIHKIILLIVFILILIPSTIRITYTRLAASENNTSWYYLSKSEFKIFDFLNKNSKKGNGVVALYRLGNIIPAYTNNVVYFGHFYQTPNAEEKLNNLYQLYSCQMTITEAQKFLQEINVKYVIWGKDEKAVSENYKKSINLNRCYTFLKPVFSNSDVTIFVTM